MIDQFLGLNFNATVESLMSLVIGILIVAGIIETILILILDIMINKKQK